MSSSVPTWTRVRSLWTHPTAPDCVHVIDQRALPHQLEIVELATADDAARAISDMVVRGAPLIGVVAAWGLALAARRAAPGSAAGAVEEAAARLCATRPTARDLFVAVERQLAVSAGCRDDAGRREALVRSASAFTEESAAACRRIGLHGLSIVEAAARRSPTLPLRIMTHCNAGRLGCVELGTATAPIYLARARGLDVFVWVSETRPRNQGALTCWELAEAGVPHALVVDSAAGHWLQRGEVDLVLVGADRITRRGDAANKIGTLLKALAARDAGVPFHVAAPWTTFDLSIEDGVAGIPIEERAEAEVRFVEGTLNGGRARVAVHPLSTPIRNPAFDVTPARLITGLITDRGCCAAAEGEILRLAREESGWPS